MNSNHFDHNVVYRSKLLRIKSNIKELEEAAKILNDLPEKMVQNAWKKVAEKELLGRNQDVPGVETSKSLKGPFKLSLKKTIQNFKKQQSDMHSEIEEKYKNIDNKTLKLQKNLIVRLQSLVDKFRDSSAKMNDLRM